MATILHEVQLERVLRIPFIRALRLLRFRLRYVLSYAQINDDLADRNLKSMALILLFAIERYSLGCVAQLQPACLCGGYRL